MTTFPCVFNELGWLVRTSVVFGQTSGQDTMPTSNFAKNTFCLIRECLIFLFGQSSTQLCRQIVNFLWKIDWNLYEAEKNMCSNIQTLNTSFSNKRMK